MRNPWIRHPSGPEENRRAAGVALAVGGTIAALVFYVARLFLARERIRPAGEISGDAGPQGWARPGAGDPEREPVGPGGSPRKALDSGPADGRTVEG